MSRRLLELCLLAYPRARRQRDRDYLRDLALDLADAQGMRRQVWSLLAGGLSDRVAGWRGARIAIACVTLVALAFAATGPNAPEGGAVSEVERFVCQDTTSGGCEEAVTRQGAGWDCSSRSGGRTTTWRCTRG